MSCCEAGRGDTHGRAHGRATDDCCREQCCCDADGLGFRRRFVSVEEERQLLENYKSELKRELEGLEERLKELGR